MEGGCQGCFGVRTLAINFYLKYLSKVLSDTKERGRGSAWISIEPSNVKIDNRHQEI